MKEYQVQSGQSLFDIAVIVYGDVSCVTWLLDDNSELKGPTDRLYEFQILNIRDQVSNVRVIKYLENFPTIATISAEDQPEGVGFWRLDEYVVE